LMFFRPRHVKPVGTLRRSDFVKAKQNDD
jgi:hypothetical protein